MLFRERVFRSMIPPPVRQMITNLLGLPVLRAQVGELATNRLVVEQKLAEADKTVAELRQHLQAIDTFLQDEVAPTGPAFPPGTLIEAVAGAPLVSWFHAMGKRGADCITDVLRQNGLEMETFDAMLDFGCGCGRVTRHWSRLPHVQVHGTDYNPELVAWCRQHLRFARFGTNQLMPPLAYDDNAFDFVYALSVFTHLAESTQAAWMHELARVVKPGGHLLVTTHGDFYTQYLDEDERRRYHAGQLVLRPGLVEGDNVCAAFQSESQVRSTLAAGWQMVACVPEGSLGTPRQDLYLLRKP
jgi:SAM-dependent methyltransferase